MEQFLTRIPKWLLTLTMSLMSIVAFGAGPRSTSPEDNGVANAPLNVITINAPTSDSAESISFGSATDKAVLKFGEQKICEWSVGDESISFGSTMTTYSYAYMGVTGATQPGTYTLSVPAGFFKYGGSSTSNLDAFSITFRLIDASAFIVSPNGGDVTPDLLKSISVTFPRAESITVNSGDIPLNDTYRNSTTLLTNYTPVVRNDRVILGANNPDNIVANQQTGHTITLTVPEGKFTVDGEASPPINITYNVVSYISTSFVSNPAFNTASPVDCESLRSIRISLKDSQSSVTQISATYKWSLSEKIENVDGSITWQDTGVKYAAQLDNGSVLLTLADDASEGNFSTLLGGSYRLTIPGYSIYVDTKANPSAVTLPAYNVKPASETRIISANPSMDSSIFGEDNIGSFSLSFGTPMQIEMGGLIISILKDNTPWLTVDSTAMSVSEDGKTITVNLPEEMMHETDADHIYTVSIPAALFRQNGNLNLPSAACEFTYMLAKVTPIEGPWPFFKIVSPTPETFNGTSLDSTVTIEYPGADQIILNDPDLTLSFKKASTLGGNPDTQICTYKVSVNGNTVTLTRNGYSSTLGTNGLNQIAIPADAWSIYYDGKAYDASAELNYYKYPNGSYESSTVFTSDNSTVGGVLNLDGAASKLASIKVTNNDYANSTFSKKGFGSSTAGGEGYLYKVVNGTQTKIATYTAGAVSAPAQTVTYTAQIPTLDEGEYIFEVPAGNIYQQTSSIGSGKNKAWTVGIYKHIVITKAHLYDIEVVSPANGASVPQVSTIELTIPDCIVIKRNLSKTISFEGYDVEIDEETGAANASITSRIEGNKIHCTVNPPMTSKNVTGGKLKITFPEGVFTCNSTDMSKEFVLEYNIIDAPAISPAALGLEFEKYTELQASGVAVDRLDRITYTFPEGVELQMDQNIRSKFSITPFTTKEVSENGSTSTTEIAGSPLSGYTYNFKPNGNVLEVTIEPAILASGFYRVRLAQGALMTNGTSFPAYDGALYLDNDVDVSVYPESGSEVETLSQIQLDYPNADSIELLDAGKAQLLVLVDGEYIQADETLSLSLNNKKITVDITPAIEVNGEYRFVLDEGAVKLNGVASSRVEADYTVLGVAQREGAIQRIYVKLNDDVDPSAIGLWIYANGGRPLFSNEIDKDFATSHYTLSYFESIRTAPLDMLNISTDLLSVYRVTDILEDQYYCIELPARINSITFVNNAIEGSAADKEQTTKATYASDYTDGVRDGQVYTLFEANPNYVPSTDTPFVQDPNYGLGNKTFTIDLNGRAPESVKVWFFDSRTGENLFNLVDDDWMQRGTIASHADRSFRSTFRYPSSDGVYSITPVDGEEGVYRVVMPGRINSLILSSNADGSVNTWHNYSYINGLRAGNDFSDEFNAYICDDIKLGVILKTNAPHLHSGMSGFDSEDEEGNSLYEFQMNDQGNYVLSDIFLSVDEYKIHNWASPDELNSENEWVSDLENCMAYNAETGDKPEWLEDNYDHGFVILEDGTYDIIFYPSTMKWNIIQVEASTDLSSHTFKVLTSRNDFSIPAGYEMETDGDGIFYLHRPTFTGEFVLYDVTGSDYYTLAETLENGVFSSGEYTKDVNSLERTAVNPESLTNVTFVFDTNVMKVKVTGTNADTSKYSCYFVFNSDTSDVTSSRLTPQNIRTYLFEIADPANSNDVNGIGNAVNSDRNGVMIYEVFQDEIPGDRVFKIVVSRDRNYDHIVFNNGLASDNENEWHTGNLKLIENGVYYASDDRIPYGYMFEQTAEDDALYTKYDFTGDSEEPNIIYVRAADFGADFGNNADDTLMINITKGEESFTGDAGSSRMFRKEFNGEVLYSYPSTIIENGTTVDIEIYPSTVEAGDPLTLNLVNAVYQDGTIYGRDGNKSDFNATTAPVEVILLLKKTNDFVRCKADREENGVWEFTGDGTEGSADSNIVPGDTFKFLCIFSDGSEKEYVSAKRYTTIHHVTPYAVNDINSLTEGYAWPGPAENASTYSAYFDWNKQEMTLIPDVDMPDFKFIDDNGAHTRSAVIEINATTPEQYANGDYKDLIPGESTGEEILMMANHEYFYDQEKHFNKVVTSLKLHASNAHIANTATYQMHASNIGIESVPQTCDTDLAPEANTAHVFMTAPVAGTYTVTAKSSAMRSFSAQAVTATVKVRPTLQSLKLTVNGVPIHEENGLNVLSMNPEMFEEDYEYFTDGATGVVWGSKNAFIDTENVSSENDERTNTIQIWYKVEAPRPYEAPRRSNEKPETYDELTKAGYSLYSGRSGFLNLNELDDSNGVPNVSLVVKQNGVASEPSTLYIDKNVEVNVDEIVDGSETDGKVIYYDLQGYPVENPEKGIYIKIENGKAEKVIL